MTAMNKKILIFPGGMPRSLDYLKKCLDEKRDVVGASSLGYDPSQHLYPAWVHLPYVTEVGFNQALKEALVRFDIGEVYTPNIVVWNHLRRILGELSHSVVLSNSSPVDEVLGGYRAALAKAQFLLEHPLALASNRRARPIPNKIEIAALIRYTDLIPGMCDNDKFHALLEIGQYAVEGDIVEIGSWWGKSAFILARLAHDLNIGKLLCVDPWTNEDLIQGEPLVDQGSAQVDANEALTIFQIGLLPFNFNHINYLRMPSMEAARYYKNNRCVSTEVFGHTAYEGHISILHIDGNHAYGAVKTDIDLWTSLVRGSGWIVIDDYMWPYGDGPKRAADAFLADNRARVATAFVMGNALFIQLTASAR